MTQSCPNCGEALNTIASAAEVQRQNRLRERFVLHRLDHRPESGELMDLTRFMHGGPGRLLFCPNCAIALREEPRDANYSDDVYDLDLLKQLYPRYLDAFRRKVPFYRDLLPPGANVVELGSHLGAFLEAAETWNWKPTGIDVGYDTSSFARSRGLRVQRTQIQDAKIPRRSHDALFIWNCFEQLDDPAAVLRASRDLLKRSGLLTVRVPNFDFYRRAAQPIRDRAAERALAYNNLLGFPYRTGYTPASLSAMLRSHGFEPIAGLNSHLITAPYPEITGRIRRESKQAFARFSETKPEPPSSLSGPWIEIICRKRL